MAEGILDRVAVLLVSYNTAGVLEECLTRLRGDGPGRLEVVVTDNASTDGSAAMVEARFPEVRLVRSSRNIGFGAGMNLAAPETSREFLLILNPDCLAAPAAIALLASRLDADRDLGFAGPRITKASGRPDHASLRGDPDPIGALLYFTRLSRLFPRSARANSYSQVHLDYEHEHDLLNGMGACLVVRRAAFEMVGGFDESFFMYGEDLDLCRRLRHAGWRGRYVPEAHVIHMKGESTRKHSRRMLVEFHRAMWIYYRKHEGGRRPLAINLLVAGGIGLLAGVRLARDAVRRE
ncbi:MAG: glycosyltransferase family 2 protein, partial [Candidatus Dormibacteria bacterium]